MKRGLIVLVPYTAGQDFYEDPEGYEDFDSDFEDEDNEDYDDLDQERTIAYLPVFVETEAEDLALMAVAQIASQCQYVTFSAIPQTAEVWEQRDYPGTPEEPGIDLPLTDPAFEIPDPGDCFCCASLEDYEVTTPEMLLKQIQDYPHDFICADVVPPEDLRREMWIEFNEWSIRILNEPIFEEE